MHQNSTNIISLLAMLCTLAVLAQATLAIENTLAPSAPLIICDFEEPDVLERLTTTPGVTVSITNQDVAHGSCALEVRVKPFSEHQNKWPGLFIGPVILAVFYEMFRVWIADVAVPRDAAAGTAGDPAGGSPPAG